MKRRIVITGIGILSPIGNDVKTFWSSIVQGKSGIGTLSRFDSAPYGAKCAAELTGFDPLQYLPHHKLKRMDLYAQYATISSQLALKDSGLTPSPEQPDSRFGISFGSGLGGIVEAEKQHLKFLARGVSGIPAALAMEVFGGAAHSNIAILNGLRGYSTTNSNSCASGTVAIGEAFRAIREGLADTMIAGGAEAPITPLAFGAFDVIKTMSRSSDPQHSCRPFDKRRDGFAMGEGAAALILEEYQHAKKRNAKIYAEVLGYALNNDAYHMTSSLACGSAAIEAMQNALAQSGLSTEDIGYINAHASGTPMNDDHEASAIFKVFGGNRPAVSGTKGYTGHPLGAAGAMEGAITALALKKGYLPHTLGCEDPEIPEGFDLILKEGRPMKARAAMSNSFGFGGINAVVVMGHGEDLE